MYAYISGKIESLSPTNVVLDCNGIGYDLQISLATYEKLQHQETKVRLFAHLAVREDNHTLYGFAEEDEKKLFLHLLSVSGIGAATARMMLSYISTKELYNAIIQGNLALLKQVKGVGPKSAQRIILELQDKLQKTEFGTEKMEFVRGIQTNQEALSALTMLGFSKIASEKAIQSVLSESNDSEGLKVEDIIKLSLKKL